jgi:putative membrane protein
MGDEGGELCDKLALDRTFLANERTVLAYIRTGLALVGMNLVIYKFIEVDVFYLILLSVVLSVPGVYILAYGFYKLLFYHKKRGELERHFTPRID